MREQVGYRGEEGNKVSDVMRAVMLRTDHRTLLSEAEGDGSRHRMKGQIYISLIIF